MLAARAATGQFLGRPAIGDRSRADRQRSLLLCLPLSRSFSLFPLFSLCGSLSWWHGRPSSASRTLTGRSPNAYGGRRSTLRPGEVASMPPGPNQSGSRFGYRIREGPSRPSPPLFECRSGPASPIERCSRCRWGCWPPGLSQTPCLHPCFPSLLVHLNQGRTMLATRASVGQFLGKLAVDDRSRAGR